jgi:hypothetical protein
MGVLNPKAEATLEQALVNHSKGAVTLDIVGMFLPNWPIPSAIVLKGPETKPDGTS